MTDTDAQILIVDDEAAGIGALRRTLRRAGYRNLAWTTDPTEAVQLCLWKAPKLILLDLHMPFMAGDQVLVRMRADLPAESYLPVIVLTGDGSREAKRRTFAAGAQDFVAKPYDRQELLFRIRGQLGIGRLHDDLRAQKQKLEDAVHERTGELRRTQIELMDRLARAAEFRDDCTGEHAQRVGALSARIAGELGLPAQRVELIWRAAALHDIGKIGIADSILLKPGSLTDEEMSSMREHVKIGARILAGGTSTYLQVAEQIALTHHEWWNGNGYLGLRGEEIPIEGRIVAVADVFDALTHVRPYKTAWPLPEAVAHIARRRGIHFDPAVVDAFLRMLAAEGTLPEAPACSGAAAGGDPAPTS
ncbi:MAG TPA: HD domain-containing phosphohydrolase [Longimicrobiaceae bacterium]|nr:HD domain-containing phosphohydrolase [Longimicrobiaceae bacterium]